jgi:hypothetical protein
MTDHLRMKGKDALTIEEAEALVERLPERDASDNTYRRGHDKLTKAMELAFERYYTREGMRKQGAAAAKIAGFTPEQMREAARKAGVKIRPEEE